MTKHNPELSRMALQMLTKSAFVAMPGDNPAAVAQSMQTAQSGMPTPPPAQAMTPPNPGPAPVPQPPQAQGQGQGQIDPNEVMSAIQQVAGAGGGAPGGAQPQAQPQMSPDGFPAPQGEPPIDRDTLESTIEGVLTRTGVIKPKKVSVEEQLAQQGQLLHAIAKHLNIPVPKHAEGGEGGEHAEHKEGKPQQQPTGVMTSGSTGTVGTTPMGVTPQPINGQTKAASPTNLSTNPSLQDLISRIAVQTRR